MTEAELGRPIPCFERYRDLRAAVFRDDPLKETGQIQIEKLGLSISSTVVTDTCADSTVDRIYDFWAPTSQELEVHFGLTIEGAVAADDPAILQARINAFLPAGVTVVVGDTVLTSE